MLGIGGTSTVIAKPFNNLTERVTLNSTAAMPSKNDRLAMPLVVAFVVIFCSAIACVQIWNLSRIANMRKDLDHLCDVIDEIKSHYGYDLRDLNAFEDNYNNLEAGYYDDDVDDVDDADDNVDIDESTSGSGADPFDYNPEEYMESTGRRKTRSASSGAYKIETYDKSYAQMRNKTRSPQTAHVDDESSKPVTTGHVRDNAPMQPQLKYDWSYRRGPRRYALQEHRAPATSYVAAPPSIIIAEVGAIDQNPTRTQIHSRQSRVMQTTEDKSKAFRQEQIRRPETFVMPRRNNPFRGHPNSRNGPIYPQTIAVHYSWDSIRNRLKRRKSMMSDFDRDGHNVLADWLASPWVNALAMQQHFAIDSGAVTVKETGLYFIYAQMFFNNEPASVGYTIQQNGETFIECMATGAHERKTQDSRRHCYTAAMSYLKAGDTVRLVWTRHDSSSLVEPTIEAQSYFGLVRIGFPRPGSRTWSATGHGTRQHNQI